MYEIGYRYFLIITAQAKGFSFEFKEVLASGVVMPALCSCDIEIEISLYYRGSGHFDGFFCEGYFCKLIAYRS